MFCRVQFVLGDDAGLAVDAHGVVDAGDEENQADVGAVLNVLVGLEQAVAGNIREQQVAVVNDLDEARLAPLGRGVAPAIGVGGSHDDKGGRGDKLLHPRRKMPLELLHRPLRWRPELPVELAFSRGLLSDSCHFAHSFMFDSYGMILMPRVAAGNACSD